MDDQHREVEQDDPAEAFERLRGEVTLLRRAVEGMTTARDSIDIPDYEPTLARTEKILVALVQQVDALRKSPAMAVTPETPASWQWPERMAMRVLGKDTIWNAGQHLMTSVSQPSWDAIVDAANLARDNRETIDRCREAALKAEKAVRCTIEVKGE